VTRRDDPWKFINRCLICGDKLRFEPSTIEGSKQEEGSKFCQQNHSRFSVFGAYDNNGVWHFWYRFPQKAGKRAA
jgi:hypothetical protein